MPPQRTPQPTPAEIAELYCASHCAFDYISLYVNFAFAYEGGPPGLQSLESRVDYIVWRHHLAFDVLWYINVTRHDGEDDQREANADLFREECEDFLRKLLQFFVDSEFPRLGEDPLSYNMVRDFVCVTPWDFHAKRGIIRLFRVLGALARLRYKVIDYLCFDI